MVVNIMERSPHTPGNENEPRVETRGIFALLQRPDFDAARDHMQNPEMLPAWTVSYVTDNDELESITVVVSSIEDLEEQNCTRHAVTGAIFPTGEKTVMYFDFDVPYDGGDVFDAITILQAPKTS